MSHPQSSSATSDGAAPHQDIYVEASQKQHLIDHFQIGRSLPRFDNDEPDGASLASSDPLRSELEDSDGNGKESAIAVLPDLDDRRDDVARVGSPQHNQRFHDEHGQPVPQKIENLVFRGGGIKGLAYCGALEVMSALGILNDVKRYAGTSAGAITAGLLAVGYKVEELEKIFRDTNFSTFKDGDSSIISKAEKLFKNYGIYKGKVFNDWMGSLLAAKTNDAEITFQELQTRFGTELVVVGTCITHMAVHYFSPYSTPTMSIKEAIRISMSIPLFFEPVLVDDHIYVDGGVTDNFPLSIFDGEPSSPEDDRNWRESPINMKTLGLFLVEDKTDSQQPVNVKGLKDYVEYLLQTVKKRIANLSYKNGDEHRTIIIQGRHISSVKFEISTEEKGLLYHEGQRAARRFFGVRDLPSPEGSPVQSNAAGHLIVKVKNACNLRTMLMATYVVVSVGDESRRSVTKYGTANPVWNQIFVYRVQNQKDFLKIYVIEHRKLHSNRELCRHSIPLDDLTEGKMLDLWVHLEVGKLNVELTWSTSF